jgi:hypothetical protein
MPDWKAVVRERLAGLNLDGAREAEIVEELAQDFEDRYSELRASGASEAEAGRVRTYHIEPKRLTVVERWISERRSLWERRLDRLGHLLSQLDEN